MTGRRGVHHGDQLRANRAVVGAAVAHLPQPRPDALALAGGHQVAADQPVVEVGPATQVRGRGLVKSPGRPALHGLVGGAGDAGRRGVLHRDDAAAGVGLALAISGHPGFGDEPRAGAVRLGPGLRGHEGDVAAVVPGGGRAPGCAALYRQIGAVEARHGALVGRGSERKRHVP